MSKKPSYPQVTTPKGVAIWPRLNAPDTKYKAEGRYTAKIAIDGDDPALEALKEQVYALRDEKLEEVKAEITEKLTKQGKKGLIAKTIAALELADPFTAEEDGETGEETGRVLINAGMNASGVYKSGPKTGKQWKRKPDIFTATGTKLENPPAIGSGSVLKLAVELFPYYAASDKSVGVSFRLNAVQLLTLVSFGERDASAYGFGEEEGDDIADGNPFSEDEDTDTDASDDGDDEL